jgi:hypothetical protein
MADDPETKQKSEVRWAFKIHKPEKGIAQDEGLALIAVRIARISQIRLGLSSWVTNSGSFAIFDPHETFLTSGSD